MSTAVEPSDAHLGLATAVRFEGDSLVVTLSNGRDISAPLTDYPRLLNATAEQRRHFQIEDFGTIIHWPDVDEDIGVNYLLGVSEDEFLEFAGFTRHPIEDDDGQP
jgi:hypothetical protein